MFYSKEMINRLGYESVEEFVRDYVSKYKNCCIRYYPNGVYLDYDFETIKYNFNEKSNGEQYDNR